MANEPEREIERTLKNYAQQRRAQAGEQRPLHPATRRVLQGEAARTFGKPRRGVRFRLLMWSSFAAGVGLIIVLALPRYSQSKLDTTHLGTPLAFYEFKKSETPVASALPREQPKAASEPAFAPAQNSASPSASAGNKAGLQQLTSLAGGTVQSESLVSKAVPAVVPQNSPVASPGIVSTDMAKEPQASRSDGSLVTNQAAALTPPPAPSVVLDDRVEPAVAKGTVSAGEGGVGGTASNGNGAVFVSQKFTTLGRAFAAQAAKAISGASTVLATFRVEQTGDEIRVIDSDGSVYAGHVGLAQDEGKVFSPAAENRSRQQSATAKDTLDTPASATFALQPSPAPGGPSPSPSAPPPARTMPNFYFRVSGTNLSSRQEVSFSGHFFAQAAPLPEALATFAARTAAPQQPATVAGSKSSVVSEDRKSATTRFRVSGSAVVGGTNQIEINAETLGP